MLDWSFSWHTKVKPNLQMSAHFKLFFICYFAGSKTKQKIITHCCHVSLLYLVLSSGRLHISIHIKSRNGCIIQTDFWSATENIKGKKPKDSDI